MTPPRTPVVIGLGRGAGASTLAAGLHAHEGSDRETAADIVCVLGDALDRAEKLVTTPFGTRPVLAVRGATPPEARLRALESRFGAVVLLPAVARWAGLAQPPDDVVWLLGQPVEHLPRPQQAYAAALRRLVAAVVRSGQLAQAAPPMALRPRVAEPWQGHVERTVRLRPVLAVAGSAAPTPVSGQPESPAGDLPGVALDDDALEAAGFLMAAATAGRVG